jgi:hypothetical protein
LGENKRSDEQVWTCAGNLLIINKIGVIPVLSGELGHESRNPGEWLLSTPLGAEKSKWSIKAIGKDHLFQLNGKSLPSTETDLVYVAVYHL